MLEVPTVPSVIERGIHCMYLLVWVLGRVLTRLFRVSYAWNGSCAASHHSAAFPTCTDRPNEGVECDLMRVHDMNRTLYRRRTTLSTRTSDDAAPSSKSSNRQVISRPSRGQQATVSEAAPSIYPNLPPKPRTKTREAAGVPCINSRPGRRRESPGGKRSPACMHELLEYAGAFGERYDDDDDMDMSSAKTALIIVTASVCTETHTCMVCIRGFKEATRPLGEWPTVIGNSGFPRTVIGN